MSKVTVIPNSSQRILSDQRGLTLIEVVITLLVLSIIAGFVTRPLINLIQSRMNVNDITTQQADAEYALTRIGNEIRFRAEFSDGSFDCSGSRVFFDKNSNLSGYKLVADQLVVKPAGDVLVTNVGNFSCTELQSGPEGKISTNLYKISLTSNGTIVKTRAYRRVD